MKGEIFYENLGRAIRVSNELRAGTNWINCYHIYPNEGMWGGFKTSGIGRELGVFAMEEYTETKQVLIKLDSEGPGWFTN